MADFVELTLLTGAKVGVRAADAAVLQETTTGSVLALAAFREVLELADSVETAAAALQTLWWDGGGTRFNPNHILRLVEEADGTLVYHLHGDIRVRQKGMTIAVLNKVLAEARQNRIAEGLPT